MQNSSGRFDRLRLVPPHPGAARCHNLPQGEGTPHPALQRVEALWIGESAADDSPSPGEGRGEGEATHRSTDALANCPRFRYRQALRPMRQPTLTQGAGRAKPTKFVRPFWLAAPRSPSPWPSPSGRGKRHPPSCLSRTSLPLPRCAPRLIANAPARRGAFASPQSGERFSLSPAEGEWAGVRG